MTTNIYNTVLQRGTTFLRTFVSQIPTAQSATPLFIAIGSPTVFTTQSGVLAFGAVGSRVLASSLSNPLNFMSGPILSYVTSPVGLLSLNIDTVGGDGTLQVSDWVLSVLDNFTGGSISGQMTLSPASCAGRVRTPIPLTCAFSSDPTQGGFAMSLTVAQTTALVLGAYDYYVLTNIGGAIRQMVSGTITVEDPG